MKKIFLLWPWNVWKKFIEKVLKKHSENIQIVWIANSKDYIFNKKWLDIKILEEIISWGQKQILEKFSQHQNLKEIIKISENSSDKIFFVDLTSWKEILLNFHKSIIQNKKHKIITANKNPISIYWINDFENLNSKYYESNTTVMAGWWVVDFVQSRKKIKDEIFSIQGCFSGTLWYILSELEQWKKTFSEIVRTAKEEWYTEPNPWDDLNWLDVARKILILARYCWERISMKDVEIEPLILEKFWNFSWEEFLQKISEADQFFENLRKTAEWKNKVLRYVWEYSKKDWKKIIKVWLKSFDKNSEFWQLNWTANIAIIETETLLNPIPHVIKSRGAWIEVTAESVISGILK